MVRLLRSWKGCFRHGERNVRLWLALQVLDKDDIAALQKLFADLSPAGEQYMNNQLGEYRRLFVSLRYEKRIDEWIQTHKPDAVGKADFWQKSFCDHRMKLKEIIDKL